MHSFSSALNSLKEGAKVKRLVWISPEKWLVLAPDGHSIHMHYKNGEGHFERWYPIMGDLLAKDWVLLDCAKLLTK